MLKKMKHTFLKFCAAIIAFAGLNVFSPDAYAQENTPVGGGGTVSGTVTDSQGPVAGAAVMIKDGKGGVITEADGTYSISGVKKGNVLIFTLLGYEDTEITWNGEAKVDVVLKTSNELLEGTVVTALGIRI